MLLITKSLPFHCNKSPATDAVGTKSKFPFVFLNAILLVLPAVEPKLTDAVTLLKVTLFVVPTPCIVPVPSKVSNLLSTEDDNVDIVELTLLIELNTEPLNAVTLAALALNEVATDEEKSPVTLATLALNDVIAALLAEVDVANAPLTEFNDAAALAEVAVIVALLALTEVATEELNVE